MMNGYEKGTRTMSISLRCECGKQLVVKDQLAGKRVKCPSCGSPITVEPHATTVAVRDKVR